VTVRCRGRYRPLQRTPYPLLYSLFLLSRERVIGEERNSDGREENMKRDLQSILDREDLTPWDVPHWIVELHDEFDERDLTPIEAVKKALREMHGHCWKVTHVRSGLTWSVCLERQEVIEVVEVKLSE
jgi:hypothetical protein